MVQPCHLLTRALRPSRMDWLHTLYGTCASSQFQAQHGSYGVGHAVVARSFPVQVEADRVDSVEVI